MRHTAIRRSYNRLLLAFAPLLFTPLSAFPQNHDLGLPFIRYYSSQEYNAGIQNWSIAQNKFGLIYVANNFGVLEHDGSSWRRFAPPNGAKVRHVSMANDGRIYVAGQGDFGYLFPDENGQLQFTSLADSLPDKYRDFDETWRVFLDQGRILFCTFNNIFIFNDQDQVTGVVEPDEAPDNFFYVNHRLYVSQLEQGLSYLDGKRLRPLPGGEAFKGVNITGIINLPNQELWVSTLHSGIFIYDGHQFRTWKSAGSPSFERASINCAIRLRNGNYALGAQNEGLFIVSPTGEVLLHLNKTRGLNNRTVLCLFEDAQDNLWLGHNNGITYIELGMPFTYINEQVGLPGTGYAGFLDGDQLYLGTNNGLYTKNIRESTDYQFVKNTEGQVYSITKMNGHLLMGHHKGAFLINGTEAVQLSDLTGSWTFLRLRDRPEYIVEGGYKGLSLFREVDGRVVFQHKIAGFDESSRVMEQDPGGDIWMTHGYKGIYRVTLNGNLDSVSSVRYFGPESGLPSKLLINVFRIRERLIFTTQNQIYRFDENAEKFVLDDFFKDYFHNDPVTALAEDPYQNIYYLTSGEAGVLEKDAGGEYNAHTDVFSKLKEMLNDDLQNIAILSANQALYGAKEGFVLYNAQNEHNAGQPYHTLIREARLTGDENEVLFSGHYIQNGRLTNIQPENYTRELPYKNNSIQFSFSAPYIDGLQRTEYQYWLENSENTWSEWTNKTEKEYTNLREGAYTFHVRARNIYGQVGETASYSFVVNPPWYRTNWTYFSSGFSALAVLFVSFYLFDKKHKRDKRAMSLRQKRELYRKETEIKIITRQSADEIQRLKNENLKAEIESKNKELATSTMHLINKNGFIANMKNSLLTISKRSKNQEVKQELKKVVHEIDQNISQDKDWEHFSFHFDQVHGDFISRLKEDYPDLSPQEMKLSAYLRMNLSTKEMAQLLNISVRGVEICRYRLRKKLLLTRADNLQEFILKF